MIRISDTEWQNVPLQHTFHMMKHMIGYALTKHLLFSVAALNVLLTFSRVNQKNDMHVHTLSKCEKQLIILMEAGGTTD